MGDSRIQVGGKILFYRKLKDLSQDQLGEAVGIDAKSVSRIERGRFYPSLETLGLIASALDVAPSQLFSDDEEFEADQLRLTVIKHVLQADRRALHSLIALIHRAPKP